MKFDVAEAEKIGLEACDRIAEVLDNLPGRKGSAERAEGCLGAAIQLLTGAAMARNGMPSPKSSTAVASSLQRRILDAIEDWEAQHVGRPG